MYGIHGQRSYPRLRKARQSTRIPRTLAEAEQFLWHACQHIVRTRANYDPTPGNLEALSIMRSAIARLIVEQEVR